MSNGAKDWASEPNLRAKFALPVQAGHHPDAGGDYDDATPTIDGRSDGSPLPIAAGKRLCAMYFGMDVRKKMWTTKFSDSARRCVSQQESVSLNGSPCAGADLGSPP